MGEKKIEITMEDFKKASTNLVCNDEATLDLIKNVPTMMLVIP